MTLAHDEAGPLLSLRKTEERTSQQSLSLLDGFLFFGPTQLSQFDQLGLRPQLSAIVGHPRYDLLSGPLNRYYRTVAEEHQREFGRFVIVAPRERDFARQIAFAERLIASQELDACIVKPHPNLHEKLECDPRSWLHFVPSEAPFGPLLLGSELLLHSGSTTALSAAVTGKPSVDFLNVDERRELLQSRFGATVWEASESLRTLTVEQPKRHSDFRDDVLVDESTSCDKILLFIEAAAERHHACSSGVAGKITSKAIRRAKALSPHGRWKLGPLAPSQIEETLGHMADGESPIDVGVTFLSEDAFVVSSR